MQAFSVPTPGLWHGPDQQPLNYSQKSQEALTHFIKLFSQPSKFILNAFAGMHSASLAAAMAGHHAVAVECDVKQWHLVKSPSSVWPDPPKW
jgi:DNA modification methylase